MCDARCSPRRRNAFTLIELLVVIAIILAIAAVGIGYAVFGQDNNHSTSAANAVTGAMLNAKQRARNDGVPTGVRLLFGTNGLTATQCGQLVLVQQPDDYTAGFLQGNPNPTTALSFGGAADFKGGADYFGQATLTGDATVEIGDYFTAPGLTTPHQIIGVGPGNITTASPVPGMATGAPYAIVRGPRRLPSEDVITLPSNLVIDVGGYGTLSSLCQNLPQRNLVDSQKGTTQVSEIVFGSSGGLVGQGTQVDKVLLWLHDPGLPTPMSGTPLIVSVQVRTGLISVYPVAPWTPGNPYVSGVNDPYAFAKDGRASGM